jgi:glutathione S-transferase
MVLKLYGHPFSTCTKRVMTVLEETKLPYEVISVDIMGGAHKKPEFVAKQPFGQIPYLVSNTRLC